eukprot:TRINITY_DN33784_c0_g1_i1.p1 TRINITY_DN33784_c0_g1~~TRINITY_DN33784_c0_g1_i1.p1  ORF type:complete len:636 (+),score=97.62 TRINITY_DN33784_c0_g1_i1:31-1938(+)
MTGFLQEPWKSLVVAVATVAEQHEIDYSQDVIENALKEQADFFTTENFVQLRLARKCKGSFVQHQLNFRSEIVSDRAAHVLQEALSKAEQSQARRYLDEVVGNFLTWAAGADFDPSLGLVKLWHFGDHTASQLAELQSAPAAVRRLLHVLEKHGFHRVFCTGVDLKQSTANLYFRLHEFSRKGTAEVMLLLMDLGIEAPADAATINYITGPGTFAMTLSWNSNDCERVCFYIMPCVLPNGLYSSRCEEASMCGLLQMPDKIKAFMDECALPHCDCGLKLTAPLNSCFVSCSLEKKRTSMYFKQESDWYNSYHDFLKRLADLAAKSSQGTHASISNNVCESRGRTSLPLIALVRETVKAVLSVGENLTDESSLLDFGLDSASAAFLRGQLTALTGIPLPGAVALELPSIESLAKYLEKSKADTLATGIPGVQVRPVRDEDWPQIHHLWWEHHHLREAVKGTSFSLLFGPPAYVCVAIVACFLVRRDGLGSILEPSTCLKIMTGYLVFVGILHALHWLFALSVLAFDLRCGELSQAAWEKEPSWTVLVAEAVSTKSEVVGVVCMIPKPLCGGCRRRSRELARQGMKNHGRVTSLWHACVHPKARNRGVASALLQAAEKQARGTQTSWLETLCLNQQA